MNDAGPPHDSKGKKKKKKREKKERKKKGKEMVSQYQYSDKNGKRFDRPCPPRPQFLQLSVHCRPVPVGISSGIYV